MDHIAALKIINFHLGIDANVTTKGDEVKCWTFDDEGSLTKTYFPASALTELSEAFGVVAAALRGEP